MASRRKRTRRAAPAKKKAADGGAKRDRFAGIVREKRPPSPPVVALCRNDRWTPVLWMGLSAVLYFFCFPQKFGPVQMELSPLAFLCLVPLTLGSLAIRGAWRGGFWAMLAGWAAMLGGLYWTVWITGIGSTALGWYLSWYWIAFYIFIRWTKRRLPRLPLTLTVPVAWVTLEFVRAYALTGFPWLYLAHSQYRVLPLIQISEWTGAYGVSALVAAVNGLVADAAIAWRAARAGGPLEAKMETGPADPWRGVRASATAAIALAAAALAYGWVQLATIPLGDGPRVTAIQGVIPQQLRRMAQHTTDPNIQSGDPQAPQQIYDQHLQLTDAALGGGSTRQAGGPDLLAWPETTVMADGGLNAYTEDFVRLYLGGEPLDVADETRLAELRAEGWYRFTSDVRDALGRGVATEWQMDGAWRVFGRYTGGGATRPADTPEARERAWGMFRRYFSTDPPPADLPDVWAEMHEEAWRWFSGTRAAEYARMVLPLQERARQRHVAFLVGATAYKREVIGDYVYHRRQNAAFLIDAQGVLHEDYYVKRHLVPFGEYLPFKNEWPWLYEQILNLSPVRGPDGKPRDHSSIPGTEDTIFPLPTADAGGRSSSQRSTGSNPGQPRTYHFATPICFEITVPRACRGFMTDPATGRRRCDLLVNISNDGWFEGTSEHYQHLSSAVFRAVEFRVPIVRAVNTGVSGFVSPTGRTYDMLPPSEKGDSAGRVQIDTREPVTFYCRYGDVFAWVLAAMAMLILAADATVGALDRRASP